jgi:ferredoxin
MSWTVRVDQGLCEGYACCVMTAPAVFDIDDQTGKAFAVQPNPDDAQRDLVDKAVRGCPTRAISIVEP